MIRQDGKFTFYIIEHQLHGKKEWSGSGELNGWRGVVPDKEKYRGEGTRYGMDRFFIPCFEAFTASGNVWQQTGVHGTYDEQLALEACQIIAKYNPEHNFRVSKITIQQEGEVIATYSYRKMARKKDEKAS